MNELAELSQRPAPAAVPARGARRLAEGPRIYDLFPPLLGPVERWFDHLPRIARMGFNWVLVSDPQQAPLAEDAVLLKAFTEAARQEGLRVMTDLVAGAGPPSPAPGLRITDPDEYIHRCLAWGIEGFICRYAAYLPGESWTALIAGARRAGGEICFVADALGSGPG